MSPTRAYVYIITNELNGKQYIGVTKRKRPEDRWWQHSVFLNDHKNSKVLYRAMRKHGIENFAFQIICCSEDPEYTLKVLEPHFIQKYNTYINALNSNGYNMTLGGDGVWGLKFSEESKKLMSDKKKQYIAEHPEYIEQLRQYGMGRISTEETNKKRSESLREYYKIHEHHGKGIPLEREHVEKIRKSNMGKKRDRHGVEKRAELISLTWEVIFPDGHTEQVKNMNKFCRQHNLWPQNMGKVAKGLLNHSEGFKCRKLPVG